MIKECRNHCYVTDKDIPHCPRCGDTMLVHRIDKTKEEVLKEVEERQNAYRKDLK